VFLQHTHISVGNVRAVLRVASSGELQGRTGPAVLGGSGLYDVARGWLASAMSLSTLLALALVTFVGAMFGTTASAAAASAGRPTARHGCPGSDGSGASGGLLPRTFQRVGDLIASTPFGLVQGLVCDLDRGPDGFGQHVVGPGADLVHANADGHRGELHLQGPA